MNRQKLLKKFLKIYQKEIYMKFGDNTNLKDIIIKFEIN